jgi:hypothetical protein
MKFAASDGWNAILRNTRRRGERPRLRRPRQAGTVTTHGVRKAG